MDEELVVGTLECHQCKKFISITTVSDFNNILSYHCVPRKGKRDFDMSIN